MLLQVIIDSITPAISPYAAQQISYRQQEYLKHEYIFLAADAAENISALIKDVQDKTEETARAISEVSGIIKQLNESSEMITSAVNNHSQETADMQTIVVDSKTGATEVTESIISLAKGANEVASNIQGVSSGMEESSKGIRQVSSSAEELATLAMQLKTLVSRFNLGKG